MAGWIALGVFVLTYAYNYWKTRGAGGFSGTPGKIEGPTASEGIPIPWLFGDCEIKSPNVVWTGDTEVKPAANGQFTYWAGMHLILCHGQLDAVTAIRAADGDLWTGEVTSACASVTGSKGVGDAGIRGTFDVYTGARNTATGADAGDTSGSTLDYLTKAMGMTQGPKYYGVAAIVARKVKWGTSPYLPAVSARGVRIHKSDGGASTQWYDAKAEIKVGKGREEDWKYKMQAAGDSTDYSSASYDDSAWAVAPGGFGNGSPNVHFDELDGKVAGGMPSWWRDYHVPVVKTQIGAPWASGSYPNFQIQKGTKIWLRADLGALAPEPLSVQCWHDDTGDLWFNGTAIPLSSGQEYRFNQPSYTSTGEIPASLTSPNGPNVIAYRVTDTNGIFLYAGLQVGPDPTTVEARRDMNPAHIIREALTDTICGMGRPTADIDDDSFTAAADQLWLEKFGISILWNRQGPIEDFIEDILRHIGAVLYVDQITGKFTLKLVRGDYNVATLPVLDETCISRVENAARKCVGELPNAITVEYSRTARGDTGAVTEWNKSLVRIQGGVVAEKVEYPGVTTSYTASKLALRDLRLKSFPLQAMELLGGRKLAQLAPMQPFKLNLAELNISGQVMRATGIDLGDGIRNQVKLSCIEDAFFFPNKAVARPSGSPIKPRPIGVATESLDYYTARIIDPRNKGMCQCVFRASNFQGYTWSQPESGVLELSTGHAGDAWSIGFDGVDPDVFGASGSWLIGKRVFLVGPNVSLTDETKALQGPWVVKNLGGHWDGYGTPSQTWVDEKVRLERDPEFVRSEQFTSGMAFQILDGTSYGGKFFQLSTAGVLLGTTAMDWTVLDTFTFANDHKLATLHQLQTDGPSVDTLDDSQTMASGSADFGQAYATYDGEPNTNGIPAGHWTIFVEAAWLDAVPAGSTTTLGMKVWRDRGGAGGETLFELRSKAITATTPTSMEAMTYNAPSFPFAPGDKLVLIPYVYTDSATPVTLHIVYNSPGRGTGLTMPKPQGLPPLIDPNADLFPVTIVNGVISGFGDHRRLLVSGTGPLLAIESAGMTNNEHLDLFFANGVQIQANGTAPSGTGAIITYKGTAGTYRSPNVNTGSVVQMVLFPLTISGGDDKWHMSGQFGG